MNGDAVTSPPASGVDNGLALAQEAVAALLRNGVTTVIVCAGARNAALVAVLAATPSLCLWSFPEERSAAFFALGRSLALDQPVAVVTTSGTAVAELLPAVIEAHYQGVPLVLVTADRPRAFRGTGAPQAIEQADLFAGYVSARGDVATVAELDGFEETLTGWSRRSPVHLNVCLGEPAAHTLAQAKPAAGQPRPAPTTDRAESSLLSAFLADSAAGPLVAVVATLPAGEHASVAQFLVRLGCPVLAEATSGLREWPALAAQQIFAGEGSLARLPVGRVLRIGGVPSSRWWRTLEQRPEVQVLSLTLSGFPGLARSSSVSGFPDWSRIAIPDPPAPAGLPITDPTHPLPAAALTAITQHPRSEPSLLRTLSACIPRGSLVFLGNSLPIREWNIFAVADDRSLRCHANRGANGIDGCVSTFLGLGVTEAESWAVVGDLTALYDLAALWITPALPPARRRIAVINNGGGRIFSRVAALQGLPSAPRRLMENPHALEFHAWASLFGWAHARATTADDIAAAARSPEPHLILEIVPDADATEAVWTQLAQDGPSPEAAPSPPS